MMMIRAMHITLQQQQQLQQQQHLTKHAADICSRSRTKRRSSVLAVKERKPSLLVCVSARYHPSLRRRKK